MTSMEKFLSQYLSHNTRDTYRLGLTKYFRLHYPSSTQTPEELSIQYLSEQRDHKSDLINFRDSIAGLAPCSRTVFLSCIIRFLEDNEVTLNPSFKRNIRGKETEPISEEYVPTNADLARLVEYMPIHARALTLCLSSSGMRIGEALSLRISDVLLDKDPVRINLKAANTKTKRKRIAFISAEAKGVLSEWLSYRSKTFPDDERLFPFSQSNYEQIWKLAVTKAGLAKRSEGTGRLTFRIHNLRARALKPFHQFTPINLREGGEMGLLLIEIKRQYSLNILESRA